MIFSQFTTDDIVSGKINQVSSGLFGTTGSLYLDQSLFATSSAYNTAPVGSTPFDVKNSQYYLNVQYNSETYFSLAYGDYANSGSSEYDDPDNATTVLTNETKVIYSEYKNTLLQPSDNLFSFASGSSTTPVDGEQIFVMNFSADKIKDQLDPGQLQINLVGTTGKAYSFIDDSQVLNKEQNVYNLISGSVVNGVPTPYLSDGSPVYAGVGLFYPSQGIVVFNAIKTNNIVGFYRGSDIDSRLSNSSTYDSSNSYFDYWRLWFNSFYRAIKGTSLSMAARRSEFVPSTNYFVRVKNKEFNYTNNPTFVSDGEDGKTKGTIIYQNLINNPRTYITSVGLYNANNELVAIGKISRPIQKSFDSELLIKVRLDF